MNTISCPLLDEFKATRSTPTRIDDCHTSTVGHTNQVSVDEAFTAFFSQSPKLVAMLMRLRNRIVGRLGFDTSEGERGEIPANPTVGDQVGFFGVTGRSNDEIVMGNDDNHFCFRVSMVIGNPGAGAPSTISITTVAYEEDKIGRAYLMIVRPFHAIVARRMAASTASAL